MDLRANCVAHYKMNDNAANTVVFDSQGFSDGIAQRNTSLMATTGKVAGALTFNGTSDYVDTGNRFVNLFRGAFSISLRFKPDNGHALGALFGDNGSENKFWAVISPDGSLIISFQCMDSEGYGRNLYFNQIIFTDGPQDWQHLVIAVEKISDDTRRLKIYLNGSLIYTSSSVQNPNWSTFQLDGNTLLAGTATNDGYYTEGEYNFGGLLDDMIILDKAPSAEEVAFLWNDGLGTEELCGPATLTASAGAGGSISPNGETEIALGSDQMFTATPAVGYEVNQWLVDSEVVHVGGNSHTLTNIDGNNTVSVTFSALAARHLCTISDVKTRIGKTDTDFDDIINSILTGIDGMFETECGRPLLMTSADVTEYYGADDSWRRLLLRRYPIISITSIKEADDYDFDAATALVLNTDYRPVNKGLNGIILRVDTDWRAGEDIIEVIYRGGYCGAGEAAGEGEYALPVELREAAITQAVFLFKRKDDIGLSSISSQGGSINKFADVELLLLVKQRLDRYKRPSL